MKKKGKVKKEKRMGEKKKKEIYNEDLKLKLRLLRESKNITKN